MRGARAWKALAVGLALAAALSAGAAFPVVASQCGYVDGDYDGLSCDEEVFLHGTDTEDPDTDGDGRLDGAEVAAGTDPLAADAAG